MRAICHLRLTFAQSAAPFPNVGGGVHAIVWVATEIKVTNFGTTICNAFHTHTQKILHTLDYWAATITELTRQNFDLHITHWRTCRVHQNINAPIRKATIHTKPGRTRNGCIQLGHQLYLMLERIFYSRPTPVARISRFRPLPGSERSALHEW